MSSDDHLRYIIQRKKAPLIDFNDIRIAGIKTIIQNWAGYDLVQLKQSGSSAKGTALHGVADFDIFISLSSNTRPSLKEIYESLYNLMIRTGIPTRKQNVSLRTSRSGLDIDLVPGKIQEGYKNFHSLYKSKTDSWTQTNIDLHINTIVNSRRINEIILTKIWRQLNQIDFPSIYLELIVLEATKNKPYDDLANNFWRVLNFLASDFINCRIVDPANTNNIISDMLTNYEKQLIQSKAKTAITKQNWSDIIW